jgi:hypothetical protein
MKTKKIMAIVVSEQNGVLRVILAPDTKRIRNEAEIAADYGNQQVDFIDPEQVEGVRGLRAIFDEMNPPEPTES